MRYEQDAAIAPNLNNPYDTSVGYYATQRYRAEVQNRAMMEMLRMDQRARTWTPGLFGGRSQLYGSMLVNSPLMSAYTGGSITQMGSGFIEAFNQVPGMVIHPRQAAMLGVQMTQAVQQRLFNGGRNILTPYGATRTQVGQAGALFGMGGGMLPYADQTHTVTATTSAGLREKMTRLSAERRMSGYEVKELRSVIKQMEAAEKKGAVGISYSRTFMDKTAKDKAVKVFSTFAQSLAVASEVLQSQDYVKANQLLNTISAGNVVLDRSAAHKAGAIVRKYQELGRAGYDTRELVATHLRTQNYLEQATGSRGLAATLAPDLAENTKLGVEGVAKGLAERGYGMKTPVTAEAETKTLAAGFGDQLKQNKVMGTIALWREQHATKAGISLYNTYLKKLTNAKTTVEFDEITRLMADETSNAMYSRGGVGVAKTGELSGTGVNAVSQIGKRATMNDVASVVKSRARLEILANVDKLIPGISATGKKYTPDVQHSMHALLDKYSSQTLYEHLSAYGMLAPKDKLGNIIQTEDESEERKNLRLVYNQLKEKGITLLANKLGSDPRYNLSSQSEETRKKNADRAFNARLAAATKSLKRPRLTGAIGFLSGVFDTDNPARDDLLVSRYLESAEGKEGVDVFVDKAKNRYSVAKDSILNSYAPFEITNEKSYDAAKTRMRLAYKSGVAFEISKDPKLKALAASKDKGVRDRAYFDARMRWEDRDKRNRNPDDLVERNVGGDLRQLKDHGFLVTSDAFEKYGYNSGDTISKEQFLKLRDELSGVNRSFVATDLVRRIDGSSGVILKMTANDVRKRAVEWRKKQTAKEFKNTALVRAIEKGGDDQDKDNLSTRLHEFFTKKDFSAVYKNVKQASKAGVDFSHLTPRLIKNLENYKATLEDTSETDGLNDKQQTQLANVTKLLRILTDGEGGAAAVKKDGSADTTLGVLTNIYNLLLNHV